MSRKELVAWVADVLDVELSGLEQLGNGALFAQLVDAYFPAAVNIGKVDFGATEHAQILSNYKVLQHAMGGAGLEHNLDVPALSRGSPAETLATGQFLHKALHQRVRQPDYNAGARRAVSLHGGLRKGQKGCMFLVGLKAEAEKPAVKRQPANSKPAARLEVQSKYMAGVIQPIQAQHLRPMTAVPAINASSPGHTPTQPGRDEQGWHAGSDEHSPLEPLPPLPAAAAAVLPASALSNRPGVEGSPPVSSPLSPTAQPHDRLQPANVQQAAHETLLQPSSDSYIADQAALCSPALHTSPQPCGAGWSPVTAALDTMQLPDELSSQSPPTPTEPGCGGGTSLTWGVLGPAQGTSKPAHISTSEASALATGAAATAIAALGSHCAPEDSRPYNAQDRNAMDAGQTLTRMVEHLLTDVRQALCAAKQEGTAPLLVELDRLQASLGQTTACTGSIHTPQQFEAVDAALKAVVAVQSLLAHSMTWASTDEAARFLSQHVAGGGQQVSNSLESQPGGALVYKLGCYQLKKHSRSGDIYRGRLVNGHKDGLGVYLFRSTGDEYAGEFCRNLMDGHGVYIFGQEGRYEGSWRAAVYHGAGCEVFARGSIFSGQYAGGLRSGWGVCRFAGQTEGYYEGHWLAGMRDGRGMQQSTDSSFVGEYLRGKRHGSGQFTFSTGDVYSGWYADDLPDGFGIYTFAGGQQYYAGLWRCGRKHGWSVYVVASPTDNSSSMWAAEWRDGTPLFAVSLAELESSAASAQQQQPQQPGPAQQLQFALAAHQAAQKASARAEEFASQHFDPTGPVQPALELARSSAALASSRACEARNKALDLAQRLNTAARMAQSGMRPSMS